MLIYWPSSYFRPINGTISRHGRQNKLNVYSLVPLHVQNLTDVIIIIHCWQAFYVLSSKGFWKLQNSLRFRDRTPFPTFFTVQTVIVPTACLKGNGKLFSYEKTYFNKCTNIFRIMIEPSKESHLNKYNDKNCLTNRNCELWALVQVMS